MLSAKILAVNFHNYHNKKILLHHRVAKKVAYSREKLHFYMRVAVESQTINVE